jgi:CheY-like chemotaxis protein
MGAMRKILVVDDGSRSAERMLSAELAELGYASVTASVDAADEILALIPDPAAIVLHLPRRSGVTDTERFAALAARAEEAGLPVVTIDPATGSTSGGASVDLQSWMCARIVNEPGR